MPGLRRPRDGPRWHSQLEEIWPVYQHQLSQPSITHAGSGEQHLSSLLPLSVSLFWDDPGLSDTKSHHHVLYVSFDEIFGQHKS